MFESAAAPATAELKNRAPKIALERLAKGEKAPREFLELAAKEMEAAIVLVRELKEAPDRG